MAPQVSSDAWCCCRSLLQSCPPCHRTSNKRRLLKKSFYWPVSPLWHPRVCGTAWLGCGGQGSEFPCFLRVQCPLSLGATCQAVSLHKEQMLQNRREGWRFGCPLQDPFHHTKLSCCRPLNVKRSAGDILEQGVLLSVRLQDDAAFERNFLQLRTYYTDTRQAALLSL